MQMGTASKTDALGHFLQKAPPIWCLEQSGYIVSVCVRLKSVKTLKSYIISKKIIIIYRLYMK